MADTEKKELKVREKQELTTPAEQTRTGLVFTPNVDIYETEKDIILVADMPGVKTKDLSIDLRDDTLTLSGDIDPFENPDEQDMMIEYEVGKFYRQFTLSEVIDQSKIDANLSDGVLRLVLPKIEKAKPRRIEVKAG